MFNREITRKSRRKKDEKDLLYDRMLSLHQLACGYFGEYQREDEKLGKTDPRRYRTLCQEPFRYLYLGYHQYHQPVQKQPE
jgi:hypothetical protein